MDRYTNPWRPNVEAIAVGVWPIARKAWYALRSRVLDMNVLMTIAIVGATIIGEWHEGAAAVVLFALASTGAAMLLGSWARSEAQVTSLAPPLGIGLGMLGGCMWPLEIVGPTMRAIGHATPHAWAVDAFIEVVGGGATLVDVGPQLAALAAFAVGLLGVALIVFTSRVRRASA